MDDSQDMDVDEFTIIIILQYPFLICTKDTREVMSILALPEKIGTPRYKL